MDAEYIVGIDLAGPANAKDTAAAVARPTNGVLRCEKIMLGLSDRAIVDLLAGLAPAGCVVALDAPLSYNDGGGDRPADKELRGLLISKGLRPGTVMAPTMTRMAYLTLRGLAVARALDAMKNVRVVEVHPGGALALRGAPIDAVRSFSKDDRARDQLRTWLQSAGLQGLEETVLGTSHELAALRGGAGRLGVGGRLARLVPASGASAAPARLRVLIC